MCSHHGGKNFREEHGALIQLPRIARDEKLRCSQRSDNRELCKRPGFCGGPPQGGAVRWECGGNLPDSFLSGGGEEPETGRHHSLIPPRSAGCTVRVTKEGASDGTVGSNRLSVPGPRPPRPQVRGRVVWGDWVTIPSL